MSREYIAILTSEDGKVEINTKLQTRHWSRQELAEGTDLIVDDLIISIKKIKGDL